jgi:hypothetical protein
MGTQNELRLEIEPESGADERELEALTLELERELSDLDVTAVEPAMATAPEGARGDAVALGALLIELGPGALSAIVGVVQAFLGRSSARSVRLKIDGDELELTGLSAEDQRRVIDSWIERHQRR